MISNFKAMSSFLQAAKYVKMQVVNLLSSFFAHVKVEFVALEAALVGHTLCGIDELRNNVAVIRFQMRDRLDMKFGDYEQVHRSLGMYIFEDPNLIVFIDGVRFYLAVCNFTE